jgi:hypothetical protein
MIIKNGKVFCMLFYFVVGKMCYAHHCMSQYIEEHVKFLSFMKEPAWYVCSMVTSLNQDNTIIL